MTPINDKLEFLEILEDRDLSKQLGRVQATYYGAYKLQTTNNIYVPLALPVNVTGKSLPQLFRPILPWPVPEQSLLV